MTKRGQKFGKVLFASMLLTLTVALGGCAGDKTAGDSTQIADTSATNSSEANTATNTELQEPDCPRCPAYISPHRYYKEFLVYQRPVIN